jgi:hypothetical protein
VPDVLDAFDVNAIPMASGAAERLVMASPSGSVAATVNVISVFGAPITVAGAVTTGARSQAQTVIEVVAEPDRAFAAVKTAEYDPSWPNPAVHANVPAVCVAFEVNVPPAVMAVPEAVRDAIASPSGSPAETVKDIGTPMIACAVAGAVTAGARSPPANTVICVVFEPERVLDAVKVILKFPVWAKVGVQLNVPAVWLAFEVNVAPAGSGAAVNDVIASPSGSAADTVKVISEFGTPETLDGAVTTGARSGPPTVIEVVAVPVRAFNAVKVTFHNPACAKLGVQLKVPDVWVVFDVNVPPPLMAVPDAVKEVMASPSGSAAVAMIVRGVFS